MIATIFLILAAASQTADLVIVETHGEVKYCFYERADEVWALEVLIDEICPGTVNTAEEQDSE